MNKYSVYKHTTPSGKVYIGITKQKPERRWRCGEGYKVNTYFYAAILKYGWDNIKHEILFEGLEHDEACTKEQELTATYGSADRTKGYNQTLGGECYQFTDEVKMKMRENHSHAWQGKHHTEETKKKISEANIGKVFSEETKKKIKDNHHHLTTFEGRKHTEESRRKISEIHFRAYGKDNPSARRVRCVETGEVFDCIKEAAEKYGANRNHIYSCCNGKRKRPDGFHWEYVADELAVV